jgi:AhpD family alkylhydroperoxidase
MTASHAARVPLVEPGTDPARAEIEARIMAERGRISTLYRALLNSAPIASGWERMLTAVRNETAIPDSLRELMILRVAVLNDAPYEFEAHVPHATRAGVSADKIEAVGRTPIESLFEPDERLALELTDAMTREIRVDDALMRRVQDRFDAKGVVEIVATIAAYNMVSRLLVALEIEH